MNIEDYIYKNNNFHLNSNYTTTNKNDYFPNSSINYNINKAEFLIYNRAEKNSSLNNEDFSEKKIEHIETKSNSHSFNNSIPKSEINFNIEDANFQNSLGKKNKIRKKFISKKLS